MSIQASQPYKCTFLTWQLCQARRATLKVGVTCLPYFRNKWDISCFVPLVTFGDFQQGFINILCLTWSVVISVTQLSQSCHPEIDTSEVMKQNTAMSFPTLQMHISDMTVVLGLKSYPQSWCHMPTLFWEISEIYHILHLWWLLVTSSRVSLTFSVWHDQQSSV